MNTAEIKATITENGNGLPSIGSLCYDANTDTVYRVTGWDGSSNITTHGSGRGNSINVIVDDVGSASDMDDDEWNEIESSNYGVTVSHPQFKA